MKTFVVCLWGWIFWQLRKVTPLYWISERKSKPIWQKLFCVDVWVFVNLIPLVIALLLSLLDNSFMVMIIKAILFLWGIARVFEIFVCLVNNSLFPEYRAEKPGGSHAVKDPKRSVILLLHNYVEIIFWYASFYWLFGSLFKPGGIRTIGQALCFSFNTITSTSLGLADPSAPYADHCFAYVLTISEYVLGVFIVLIALAYFISLFHKPKTMDKSDGCVPPKGLAKKKPGAFWNKEVSLAIVIPLLIVLFLLVIWVAYTQINLPWTRAIQTQNLIREEFSTQSELADQDRLKVVVGTNGGVVIEGSVPKSSSIEKIEEICTRTKKRWVPIHVDITITETLEKRTWSQ